MGLIWDLKYNINLSVLSRRIFPAICAVECETVSRCSAGRGQKLCSVPAGFPSSPNPFIVSLPRLFANSSQQHGQVAIFRQDYPRGHQSPYLSPESYQQIKAFILVHRWFFFSFHIECTHLNCSLFLSLVSSGKAGSLWYLLARCVLPRQWKYCFRAGEQVPRYFSSFASLLRYSLIWYKALWLYPNPATAGWGNPLN